MEQLATVVSIEPRKRSHSRKLTKSAIDNFHYSGEGRSRQVLWDSEIKGFGLRVFPSNRKSFVLSYRSRGRKHLMAVGDFGLLTVDQARALAMKKLVEVIEGKNPLLERQREQHGQTVKDLCEAFLERHSRPHKKSWRDDERRIKRAILPAWGTTQINAVTREEVARLHHGIGQRAPYEANRVLALLRKMFRFARRWGLVDSSMENPATDIDKYRERKRDRWITRDEMPRLAAAVAEEPNPFIRAAIWLYLLTGLRKSELLQVTWANVDLDRRELRLEDTKAGRPHYVPLSEPAVKIFRELPRQADNPFVFPGKIPGRPLVEIKRAWDRIRKAANVEDLRLHDLRRTVGSWLAQDGASLHLIGRVLNHTNPSTTQVYARFAQENVREVLESHAAKLKPLLNPSMQVDSGPGSDIHED